MIGGVNMKDFNNFREYMKQNGSRIADEIQSKTDSFIDENGIDNIMTADNTYTQIAIMKMLEEYHNWLNKS